MDLSSLERTPGWVVGGPSVGYCLCFSARASVNWPLWVSAFWTGSAIGLLVIVGVDSLSHLGDFLAGWFAPLAFLWFVLAFHQQRIELVQNTQQLRAQARASRRQADAALESLEQQRDLLALDALDNAPVILRSDVSEIPGVESDPLVSIELRLQVANAPLVSARILGPSDLVDQWAAKENYNEGEIASCVLSIRRNCLRVFPSGKTTPPLAITIPLCLVAEGKRGHQLYWDLQLSAIGSTPNKGASVSFRVSVVGTARLEPPRELGRQNRDGPSSEGARASFVRELPEGLNEKPGVMEDSQKEPRS